MITAVIQSGKNTLITDLPRPISDLQNKLLSIGVNLPPPEDEKKPTGKKDVGKQSSKDQPGPKPSKGGTEMRPVPPSRRTPLNKQEGMPHEPS